ncbi:HAD superfamily (Gph) (PDB:2NYV) [Commensalibacter communis]|uniref:phosphoglycolate phosphatase n=1 Tax=Commensalibacter communis TaxID=2972786 RepID=A0A9W4X6J2_9PROT|nr:HAD-IA family hydrolase [Commensalibacter communis]CAI3939700.1 HAD superfamily (Gph) (PDB:2NYV) [Commensalibacter communis]CAI3940644.1 HAD superfamily (Gph) (PDB:2NYV) [Commensalibacter communis]CAI3943794.1 HAD superfamily (Gph) (PDB:2NYV) [Commensalibacter communis]CAI3946006.1 HAD superfamily (Gph) (PDB:2NYV) [Commensalibacter communis]CAI3946097.1 HAD superfamily (Gph) (PDB:2NYV) [Commensalibacter communis]
MVKRSYSYVIFDLDGTLVNTAPDIALCVNELLRKRLIPTLNDETVSQFIGGGTELFIKNLYSFLSIQLTDSQLADEVDQFFQLYMKTPVQKSNLYDTNTYSVMKTLTEKGIKIGICTNKIEVLTIDVLKYFNLFDLCSTVVCGDTLSVKKPNPLPLLTAMEQINANSNNTLYVGDTRIDLECCQSASVDFVAVQWGMDKELLALPVRFLKEIEELLAIVC